MICFKLQLGPQTVFDKLPFSWDDVRNYVANSAATLNNDSQILKDADGGRLVSGVGVTANTDGFGIVAQVMLGGNTARRDRNRRLNILDTLEGLFRINV